MTDATDLMHERADICRRRAILEAVVAVALLAVTVLCALRGETWHAVLVALAAGATISAAGFTYAEARLWGREADKRDEATASLSHPWPSPTAEKGIAK